MKENEFGIGMDEETMQDFIRLVEWLRKTTPFIPERIISFESKVRVILDRGCFKHGKLCTRFRVSDHETNLICPMCAPDDFAKLKKTCKVED